MYIYIYDDVMNDLLNWWDLTLDSVDVHSFTMTRGSPGLASAGLQEK